MEKIKNKKGVTVLETALMIGFIYVLLGLIFSGGQLVNNKMALNAATYRTARMVAVSPSVSEAKRMATEEAEYILKKNGMAFENIRVEVTPKDGIWKKGNTVTVKVMADTSTLFPIPDMENPVYAGTKVKMISNVVMMIESE